VPPGLIITLAVWAVVTALSLWPIRRPRRIALAVYLITCIVGEIPQVFAVLVVASVLPGLLDDELDTAAISLGWAVLAIILMGLAVLAWRGVRARSAVDRGLRAAGLPATRRGQSAWKVLIQPFPVRPRVVERIVGVPYGDHPLQRLDLYKRRDGSTNGPVLVYVHGGGYSGGGRHREGRALLHHLAERGWLCVSADYRLRPEVGLDGHLADARRVIGWVREHAAEHGARPDGVVMAGSSAGAHLASMCALTPDESTPLAAAICLYGYYGRYYERDADEARPSTPFGLDPSRAPAMLIAHGSLDTYTPAALARDLAARLAAASAGPIVHAELPGGQHGFDVLRSWRVQALLDGVDVLADKVLAPDARLPE